MNVESARRQWRSYLASSLSMTILIGIVAAGSVLALRALGALQTLELATYDLFVQLRANQGKEDPRILLVVAGERDIQKLGRWPVTDGLLAQAVERLDRAGARVIGLDIYRDISVPPGTEQFRKVLLETPNLFAVTTIGDGSSKRVEPPSALRGTDRVAFNDILVDSDGIVRRGLLFVNDDRGSLPSFALSLALAYLAGSGIALGPDPGHPQALRLGNTVVYPVESNDGPYVGVDPRGYQYFLDYRAGPDSFETVSLTSLLAGEVDADVIRNRIALIGVDAASVKDYFFTPLDRGLGESRHHAGLTLHAHAVNQLLRMALLGQSPLRPPGKYYEALLVALCGLLGSLVALYGRATWRLLLATALGLSVLAMVAYLGLASNWWVPLIPPASSWVLAVAFTTAYLSYREAAEHAALMTLFSRHVSREVAEAIWERRDEFAGGGHPRPQHVGVTALFTDIAVYTPTAESLPPEQLLDWLNEYMDAIAGEIGRHGGIVRQYVGDEVVAIFGAPIPRTTDAEIARDASLAVECALAIQEGLLRLNRRFGLQGRPKVAMRAGIFTGPAVSGLLGSAKRAEYTVIGDTLNTASRLESFDKDLLAPDPDVAPCRILVGGSTLAYLGNRFVTEFVGEPLLKGKRQRVAIYRVLGRQTATKAGQLEEEVDEEDHATEHSVADIGECRNYPASSRAGNRRGETGAG